MDYEQEFLTKRWKEDGRSFQKDLIMRRYTLNQPNIHPLLIDHVLESVFENLPKEHQHLLHTRLVCREWSVTATKALQKKSNAIISFGKFRHPAEKINQLIQLVSGSEIFPFVKFKFCQDIFQPHYEPLLQEFFEVCGPLVESLIIWLDVESTFIFPDKWSSILNMEQLKCLHFDDRRRNHGDNGQNFLKALLSSSPNLEKMILTFPPESLFEIDNRRQMMIRIINILTENPPKRVKDLKLDLQFTDEFFHCLSEVFSGLEVLHLCLRTSNFDPKSLNQFLDSQRHTLQRLKFTDLCKRSTLKIEFPRMVVLNYFEIHGWDNPVINVVFKKFNYKDQLPKLRELKFSTWAKKPDWMQFFLTDQCDSTANIEEIKLPQDFDSPELLPKLSSSFSGLRRLEIHYSWETIPVLEDVFEFLTQLMELKINQSFPGGFRARNIDHVFTGIHAADCRRILKEKSHRMNDLSQLERKPSLLNLERLTVLDMKDLHYQAVITDVTGYLVLLRMKRLKFLYMGRSYIKDDCMIKLANRFPSMKQQLSIPRMKLNYDSNQVSNTNSKCCIF